MESIGSGCRFGVLAVLLLFAADAGPGSGAQTPGSSPVWGRPRAITELNTPASAPDGHGRDDYAPCAFLSPETMTLLNSSTNYDFTRVHPYRGDVYCGANFGNTAARDPSGGWTGFRLETGVILFNGNTTFDQGISRDGKFLFQVRAGGGVRPGADLADYGNSAILGLTRAKASPYSWFMPTNQADVGEYHYNLDPNNLDTAGLNTGADEINPAPHPDGRTLYFARRSRLPGSRWNIFKYDLVAGGNAVAVDALNQPVGQPGQYDTRSPEISADGTRIYFASNRPVGDRVGYDLWVSTWVGDRWSVPTQEGLAAANTPANNEIDPSISADGSRFYFSSDRVGPMGYDLYECKNGEDFMTGIPLPAAPTWLSAQFEDGYVRLNWNPVDGAVAYRAYRDSLDAPGHAEEWVDVAAGTGVVDFRMYGSNNYYGMQTYRVAAVNAAGEGTPGGPVYCNIPVPAQPVPLNVSAAPLRPATRADRPKVTVSWEASGAGEQVYQVQRRAHVTYEMWTEPFATLAAPALAYTDEAVDVGRPYRYAVAAAVPGGLSDSLSVAVHTTVLPLADLDDDGDVDPVDLALFARTYQHSEGQEEYNPQADFDHDGTVGPIDLAIFVQWWQWKAPQ